MCLCGSLSVYVIDLWIDCCVFVSLSVYVIDLWIDCCVFVCVFECVCS